MVNEKVVIEEGRIYIKDYPKRVVMDEVSKDLMYEYAKVVTQTKGKVLDVGFGLGYSANYIYELTGNYTCIEINPEIYKKAIEWSSSRPNTRIYFGNWVDIIPILNEKFDGIFMDTFEDIDYNQFEDYAKLIANQDCILSIYSYFAIRDPKILYSKHIPLDLNANQKYIKPIEKGHTINWTVFNNGEFEGIKPTTLL